MSAGKKVFQLAGPWTRQIASLPKSAPLLGAKTSSQASSAVRDYEDIPPLPRGLPFIGNVHMTMEKKHRKEEMSEVIKGLFRTYDPQDVGLLRAESSMINRDGKGRILIVKRPDDIETVWRQEGKYPDRGVYFEALKKWRKENKDIFKDTTGILTEEKEAWHKVRSLVQQDMMRPNSAMFYVDQLNEVTNDFLDHLEGNLDQELMAPPDFLNHLQTFAFESICVPALDTRLGCFQKTPDPEIKKVLESVIQLNRGLPDVVYKFPWWKISPYLSPDYLKMAKNLDTFGEFAKPRIMEARERIRKRLQGGQGNVDETSSMLDKLIIKCGPESSIPLVMAYDMLQAGIDTTGNSAAFLLHNVAANPDKQETMREEVFQHCEKVTESSLKPLKYLKAAIRESARLTPIASRMMRKIHHDFLLRDFHIPANTIFMFLLEIASRDAANFPDPDLFVPERWLREGGDQYHKFASVPFGFGPRMCIGRRFAELELLLLLVNVLKRYRLETSRRGPPKHKWKLVNTLDEELKIKFIRL